MKDKGLQLLLEMLGRFTTLSSEDIDAEIELALHVLNASMGTERCAFYVLSDDRRRFILHSQSHDDELSVSAMDASQRSWFSNTILAGKAIAMPRLPEDLPPEAGDERAYVQASGAKSQLAIPIVVGRRVRYALATATFNDYRQWNEKNFERLRLVGQLFAYVLQRRNIEQDLRAQLDDLRPQTQPEPRTDESHHEGWDLERFRIIGQSPSFTRILDRVALVAPLPTTVLLLGETGTGKELLAWAIHERSARREKPFVKVNCAALPPSLIESEFFGHEKGAFTGAISTHQGRFELADGGTIFLDEIGDLPLELQPKLLRLLQDGEVQRIGSTRSKKTNVRIIAATNQHLKQAVAEGRFRRDLYYRLSVFPIEIPPLRERKEDIPLIVRAFVREKQAALGKRIEEIPQQVMEALVEHDWPGNVRELENVIERAMILSPEKTLRIEEGLIEYDDAAVLAAESTKDDSFDAAAREHVHAVLERCGWRINGSGGAAEILAIHPNTLRARLKKLGLARPESA